jgi:predicted AlkP superfamily pyrophosphatase or phosphodiesterase
MKIIRLGIVLSVSLLTAWFCQAAETPHVVLITLDGFPARMFWDPKTPIPHLRKLAAEGAVAEGMRASNPTVTWPNHTTLVTGVRASKHSVLYNGMLLRGLPGSPVRIEPHCDKSQLVAVPTLYDELHRAGLRTAAINWPCTRNSGSLDDDFPDVPDNVLHTTPRLRQELVEQHILSDETDASFRTLGQPGHDQAWTKSACYVISARRPHLLLFHLLNTDSTHHRYGPESAESYAALGQADAFVGQLLAALDAAGIRTNTTVFIVADHGFASVTNLLQPNVLFRQAGLLETGPAGQLTNVHAIVVAEGGTGMIYLTDPATREADRNKIIKLLGGKPGVAALFTPDQYAALGLPSPEQNPRAPDLLLAAEDGYSITGNSKGDDFVVPVTGASSHGSHGYLASNAKMNALFLASGRGIKRGVKVGLLDNIDVAPTIAHLLGQPLPGADGKVISEILALP